MGILKYITRVKMVKCIYEEPQPPCNSAELESWCNLGYSARPVQQHVRDIGIILWKNGDDKVRVQFDAEINACYAVRKYNFCFCIYSKTGRFSPARCSRLFRQCTLIFAMIRLSVLSTASALAKCGNIHLEALRCILGGKGV